MAQQPSLRGLRSTAGIYLSRADLPCQHCQHQLSRGRGLSTDVYLRANNTAGSALILLCLQSMFVVGFVSLCSTFCRLLIVQLLCSTPVRAACAFVPLQSFLCGLCAHGGWRDGKPTFPRVTKNCDGHITEDACPWLANRDP